MWFGYFYIVLFIDEEVKILYLSFFFCLFIFLLLLIAIIFLFGLNHRNNYLKLIIFECGFTPLINRRNSFSLRFFLIVILFLIFDIEIILFIPLRFGYNYCSFYFVKSVCTIILLLIIGLLYE